jgi:hypothetical protein
MKKGLFMVLAAGLLAGSVNAAQIDLQGTDGSNKVVVDGTGTLNVVIITAAVDATPVAFVNAFLDATNGNADVTNAVGGQNWTYDRTAFKYPAELDLAGGNEYGLVSGDSDGGDELPLGSATHIIDSLTLSSAETSGSTAVFFELGARQPQVFGPAPTYTPFTVAPFNFPPGFPGFLYVGDPVSTNSPTEINYIPEPAALALLALGGLVAIRRR